MRVHASRKPLSLHAVSFGSVTSSGSLRRMVTIADQVAQAAPRDPMAPLIPCSYTDAIDTVCMTITCDNRKSADVDYPFNLVLDPPSRDVLAHRRLAEEASRLAHPHLGKVAGGRSIAGRACNALLIPSLPFPERYLPIPTSWNPIAMIEVQAQPTR